MEAASKRFNVSIIGKVHDLGFRDFVEKLANFRGLKGYIFNDIDGSVKMIIEGKTPSINSFLEDIQIKSKNIGAEVSKIVKEEVSKDFFVPPKFIKIPSTEYEELGRKLDKGIELLRDIKGDTSALHDIKDILKVMAEKP